MTAPPPVSPSRLQLLPPPLPPSACPSSVIQTLQRPGRVTHIMWSIAIYVACGGRGGEGSGGARRSCSAAGRAAQSIAIQVACGGVGGESKRGIAGQAPQDSKTAHVLQRDTHRDCKSIRENPLRSLPVRPSSPPPPPHCPDMQGLGELCAARPLPLQHLCRIAPLPTLCITLPPPPPHTHTPVQYCPSKQEASNVSMAGLSSRPTCMDEGEGSGDIR